MPMLTITAKGQVTLRQALLKHLGVGPGQKVEVDKLPDGQIRLRAAARKGTISDFIGCLSKNSWKALTIDEMKKIADKGWAAEE